MSEVQLEPELDDTSVAGGKNSSERARLAPDIWRPKHRVIKCVEKLGSDLEVAILMNVEPLRDREVTVCHTGTAHDSYTRIAECLGGWIRYGKSVGVEPTLDGPLRSV